MKYIKWFIRNTQSLRWMLALSILCQFILVFCALALVIVSKSMIDCVTLGQTSTFLGAQFGDNTLKVLIIMMFGVIILRLATNAVRSWLQTKSRITMENNVRQMEFENILHFMSDYRSKYHSGDIMNRIGGDVDTLASVACVSIPNIIGAGLQFLCAFLYLLFLAPGLAWILVILAPLGILGGKFVMHKTRQLTLRVRNDDSRIQSHLQESIQNLSNIKTLEYEEVSGKKTASLQTELYSDVMKRLKFTISAGTVINATFSISYAIVFIWGAIGILHKTITFGTMTAFLQIVGQITRPLMEMSSDLPAILNSTASIDRLLELEDMPSETKGRNYAPHGHIAGIRITDMDFAYKEEDDKIFDHFNAEFAPGTRTAIVGETGVGKSTLVKLLLALEKPQGGQIEIYSEKWHSPISPSSRCNMVYVPQGNSLLSGTIRENLLMGKPNATEDELYQALHTAAADFVEKLPNGIDTQCFESGAGLSEGQAQRIAIARGLLRPGTILIMDEFSSALDPQTEELLMERLSGAFYGKTMIFITHREKIAEYCDRILRLDRKTKFLDRKTKSPKD